MPVPSPRNPILPARGNYADLLANVTALSDGEICYAIDQDIIYMKEGDSLVAVGSSANVNADWNATSGDAQILNKPTLGTAAAQDVGADPGDVVQLDETGKLPAVDASQLTNLPSAGATSEGIGYALSLSTAELTDEADIQKHRMSAPGTITELRYECPLAAPTGSALELDVLKNGVSILSTRLTIDVGEISSDTAAVPAVISDASFEAGDVYSFSRTQGDVGATARGDRIFMFYQEA